MQSLYVVKYHCGDCGRRWQQLNILRWLLPLSPQKLSKVKELKADLTITCQKCMDNALHTDRRS